jgi:hypothetical protein
MRIVIENGNHFTKFNFFMMLKELNPGHIESNAGKFLIIMKEEIGVSD